MASNFHVPSDVLTNIFLKLPAKALGRFKCVCTLWCNLISDSYFVKKHLRNYPHPENLILGLQSHGLFSVNTNEIFNNDKSLSNVAFSSEVNPDRRIDVMGSCHGLIFLVDEAGFMFLANPTTGVAKKMKNHWDMDLCCTCLGFGYDPSTDDYLVVAVYYHAGSLGSKNVVFRYRLRTDSWEELQKSPFRHIARSSLAGVLVQGRLYWLANHDRQDNRLAIVAFDWAEKRFEEVPCPYFSSDDHARYAFDLVDIGGNLCMFARTSFQQNIFVMGEYGTGESWCHHSFGYDPMYSQVSEPVCLSRDDREVVWLSDEKRLLAAKTNEGSWRIKELYGKLESAGTCLETLVSPQG